MYFTKIKYFSTKYTMAIAWFILALLTGCSDGNNKEASSSPVSSSSATSTSISSTSVSSSSSSGSSVFSSPHVGRWYAPAYGYVLSVGVESDLFTVKTYSVTKNYCLLQNVVSNLPLADLKQDYVYSNLAKEILLQNKGDYPPDVEFEKLKQLPDVCEENLQKLKADSGYIFDAKNDFEIFWQTFDELYINFELRGITWNEVYDEAIKSIDDIKDEEELFEFLSMLIEPLGDSHVVLIRAPLSRDLDESISAALENDETPIFSASTKLTLYQKLVNEYVQALEADGELESELTDVQIAAAEDYILDNVDQIRDIIFGYADENSDIEIRAAGEIAWLRTNDNIGYIFIGSMSDYSEGRSTIVTDIASDVAIAEAAINEALKDLGDTDGLIIDIRFNNGGQDQVALNFVRHFMSKPQIVYSKFAGSGAWATPVKEVVLDPQSNNIYLKPTAVLVGGDTVSAAEIFTLAMASLPQVAIIGFRYSC